MDKIQKTIKGHWEKQKVKFAIEKGKLKWIKTLRSVDCAICKKHLVERREDEGFDDWRIMPEIVNPQGLAPEICPECAKKFNLPFKPARRIRCKKCGIVQKEKIFGIGFPGWLIAPHDQSREMLRGFCPQCYIDFIAPSMPEFIHSTWYDLTFASGSLLTSTKMTQLDGNFDALAAGDTGAPQIARGALKTTTGSVSHNPSDQGANYGSNVTLPGGSYAFYPQVKTSPSSMNAGIYIIYDYGNTSYATKIFLFQSGANGGSVYAQSRYIQASPPYEIEHFIYLLADENGKIISGWEAPDPPWYGQGINGKATIEDFPSPFLTVKNDQKVILVNSTVSLLEELKQKKKQYKKGYLEFIHEGDFVIDDAIHKPRGEMTERIIAKGVEFRPLRNRRKK